MRSGDSLTTEEFSALLRSVERVSGALAVRDRTILEILGGTGLSISELVALRVRQVVRDGRAVAALKLTAAQSDQTRGRKIPLSDRLRGHIEGYVIWLRGYYKGNHLFPGYEGTPLTTRAVQKRMRRLATAAGLAAGKVSPHCLKEFFINHLVDSSMDCESPAAIEPSEVI
ncbi:MAG TPA: tyrosine-type recombinase/integrase [Blastocatellia bacterium]|nr:tyrosine-type recombinase/integrase [Blastocatellia bacterium]